MIRPLLLAGLLFAAAPHAVIAQAPAAAASDPARLTAAQSLALKLVPPGTYQRMMSGSLKPMMGGMYDQMLDLPAKQLLASFGLPNADVAKLNGGTLRQIMGIIDPAFEQRMKLVTSSMFDSLGDVFTKVEPDLREGMAEAYASRFTVAQLGELNAFFATPTGTAFAGQQLTIMQDPALMKRMQNMLPLILRQMPEAMKRVQAQVAALPKPKTAADLTDADRQKLAALIGVSPDRLKAKPK
jgi:hypothetical protein